MLEPTTATTGADNLYCTGGVTGQRAADINVDTAVDVCAGVVVVSLHHVSVDTASSPSPSPPPAPPTPVKLEFTLTGADIEDAPTYCLFLIRTADEHATDPAFVHWCVERTFAHRPEATSGNELTASSWTQRINAYFEPSSRKPQPSTSRDCFVNVRCLNIPQHILHPLKRKERGCWSRLRAIAVWIGVFHDTHDKQE